MGNAKIPADEAKSAAAPSTSSATAEAEGGLKKETSTTQAPPPPAGPLSGAAMYNPVMQQAHPGHTPGLAPQGASAAPVYYTAMPLAQGGAVPRHARPSNGSGWRGMLDRAESSFLSSIGVRSGGGMPRVACPRCHRVWVRQGQTGGNITCSCGQVFT